MTNRSLQQTASAAKAMSGGLRLNRTGGLTEYVQSPYDTPLTSIASNGSFYIWFRLTNVGVQQCVYSSLETAGGFRTAIIEVTAANDLVGYYTGSTSGTAAQVTIATGIQANTLYLFVYSYVSANLHRVYLNGTLRATLTTQLGLFHNNLIVGARKYASTLTPPVSGGNTTSNSGNGYFFHANMTVFEAGFTGVELTANAVNLLWNNGRGMMPERKRLGALIWRHVFKFQPNRVSGSVFSVVLSTASPTQLTLFQSAVQALVFVSRLASSVV